MSLVARPLAGQSGVLGSLLRQHVHEIDPGMPVEVSTMSGILTDSLATTLLQTHLLISFGATALALAAMGIFGVISYTVRRRYREIGIHMALGADHRGVLLLVVREGMVPVALGIAVGLTASLLFNQLLSSLVSQIGVSDPVSHLSVAAILVVTALIAVLVPARWATSVGTMQVLRSD
jgi:putative ABC transport system permease protein